MPQINANIELSEFDNNEIAHYLVHKKYTVTDPDGKPVTNTSDHYWTPEVDVDIDIDLDDLDEDDLVEYLEDDKGYVCTKDLNLIRKETTNPLRTLAYDAKRMADDHGHNFWRDFLTEVLFIPSTSSDTTILNGIHELLNQ